MLGALATTIVLLIGAGYIFLELTLRGLPVPPSVTLVLGIALSNLANLLLSKKAVDTMNGYKDRGIETEQIARRLDTRSEEQLRATIEARDRLREENEDLQTAIREINAKMDSL